MSTVLYLSSELALWVCVKRQTIVDYTWEKLEIDSVAPYKGCRWFNGKSESVHLLIDCEQSEIDRYPLLDVRSAWQSRSNKRALQTKLTEQFPDAIVQTVGGGAKNSGVVVQHINLSEPVLKWMSYVEKSEIVFCSVTTVADVLAARWGKGSRKNGYVVVNKTSQFIRFTYCQFGSALFTRAIRYPDATQFKDQLILTLDYLHASGLVLLPVPVYCIGLGNSDFDALQNQELVGKVVDVDTKLISNSGVEQPDPINSKALSLVSWLVAGKLIHNNNSDRQVSFSIGKYLNQQKRKRLQVRFGMVASFFIASMIYTTSSERQRLKHQQRYSDRKAELVNAISAYQAEAESLTTQSDYYSRVLLDKMTLESVAGVSPAILLTTLAQAFTQFRELELHELQWAMVDSSDLSEHAHAAADGTINLYARALMPGPEAASSVARVIVTGTVNESDSLREQHNMFNRLIDYLQVQEGVANLVVLSTPLSQFDSTSRTVTNQRDSRPEFKFQFSFRRADNSAV